MKPTHPSSFILHTFLALLCASAVEAADVKISELPSASSISASDIFPVVISPSGSAITKKATFTTLSTFLANSFQPLDSDLTSIAALSTTSYGRSVLTTADSAALRTLAGLVIGANVQAYDADLTTWAGITPSANVQSLNAAADYAAIRTLLGLVIGTNVQAYDSDLDIYASITPSANVQTLLGAASFAAFKSSLALNNVENTALSTWTGTTTLTTTGTVTTGTWSGLFGAVSGANLTTLNASNLSSGTVPTARLGSGTANNTKFLRGDSTWGDLFSGVTTTAVSDFHEYPLIFVPSSADGDQMVKLKATGFTFNPNTGSLTVGSINTIKIWNGAQADLYSVGIGEGTLAAVTANNLYNVAVGDHALGALLDGTDNNAYGRVSLGSLTHGSYNTAFGNSSLNQTTTGDSNTAFGTLALSSNVSGAGNIALGAFAGAYVTSSYEGFINGIDRSNATGDRTKSIIYFLQDATVGNQTLTVNAGSFSLNGGTSAGDLRLMEPSGSGTNYTGFKSPALAANVIYTLPTADGGSGDVLSTNGSKVLSWASPGAASITVGSSGISSGTASRVLYETSGNKVGEITGATSDGTTLTLVAPILGTPTSGTLTNCTGLPVSGITSSTSTALGLGSIELGHATDTTISRSSAGVMAVEGVVVPSISSTNTLTNKRVTARITTITSSATPTVNTDDCDCVTITALAAAITSMTSNLSGTPVNFDQLEYRIKDDTNARAITWGASFASGTGTLPTTTTVGKVLHVFFEWDSVQSKWICLSTGSEP